MPMSAVIATSARVARPRDDVGDSRWYVLIAPRTDVELRRPRRPHVAHEVDLPMGPLGSFYFLGAQICRTIAG